jgi:putative transposase
MQRFKPAGQAHRFLSAHGFNYGHFRSRRHRMTAGERRAARAEAFRIWREETCVRKAARPPPSPLLTVVFGLRQLT